MVRRLTYFLKMYLGFSRRESRGFLMVFPFLVLLYLIPVIYNRILKFTNQENYKTYLEQVDLIIASAGQASTEKAAAKWNLVSGQDTTQKLKVYIKPKEPQLNLIDFSEADSILLQVVPGIGQVLAGRIIKYRDKLGGMHSQQQLLEVYGVTEEVANRVFEYFPLTPLIGQTIKVNELDVAELAEHPYISFGHAKVIVAYREQHGRYQKPEDLLRIKIFNKEWLDRLRPYLEF